MHHAANSHDRSAWKYLSGYCTLTFEDRYSLLTVTLAHLRGYVLHITCIGYPL